MPSKSTEINRNIKNTYANDRNIAIKIHTHAETEREREKKEEPF